MKQFNPSYRRTLFRRLEDLRGFGYVESPKKGVYRLTKTGEKRYILVRQYIGAEKSLVKGKAPSDVLFSFHQKDGKDIRLFVHLMTYDKDFMKMIREALMKDTSVKGRKRGDVLLSGGSSLSMGLSLMMLNTIFTYFKLIDHGISFDLAIKMVELLKDDPLFVDLLQKEA